jgi:hypothetical protein
MKDSYATIEDSTIKEFTTKNFTVEAATNKKALGLGCYD